MIALEEIRRELDENFFFIAIGWAWTNLAITDCAMDVSPTCPIDQSWTTMLVYLGVVVICKPSLQPS